MNEVERMRSIYQERDKSGKPQLYAWHRQEVLFSQWRLNAEIAKLLTRANFIDWKDKSVLDIGCGAGGWLRKLLDWGATPELLHGIDLLPDRIEQARHLAPHIDWQLTNGEVPFSDSSMDLVNAHTVFSSILDSKIREDVAKEMLRVLKPDGLILIYDFRISHPKNLNTIDIGVNEIKRLFPSLSLSSQTLTLAPPIARIVVPRSALLAYWIECWVPFLRTHAVYMLKYNRENR